LGLGASHKISRMAVRVKVTEETKSLENSSGFTDLAKKKKGLEERGKSATSTTEGEARVPGCRRCEKGVLRRGWHARRRTTGKSWG